MSVLPMTVTGEGALPALISPHKPFIIFSLPVQLRRAVTEQLWASVSSQGQPSTQPQHLCDSAKTEYCLFLRLLTEFELFAASTYSLFYPSINQLSKYSTRQEISIPLIQLWQTSQFYKYLHNINNKQLVTEWLFPTLRRNAILIKQLAYNISILLIVLLQPALEITINEYDKRLGHHD